MRTNAVARAGLDLETVGQGLARAEVDEVGSVTVYVFYLVLTFCEDLSFSDHKIAPNLRVRVALASGGDIVDLAGDEATGLESVGTETGLGGTLGNLVGLAMIRGAADGRGLGEGGNAAEGDESRLEHHLEG